MDDAACRRIGSAACVFVEGRRRRGRYRSRRRRGASGWSNAAVLSTANNDYFEFAATTTNYNSITFAFDARRDATLLGPASLQLFSSTDGTTFDIVNVFGQDEIALTMEYTREIEAFEARHTALMPWLAVGGA